MNLFQTPIMDIRTVTINKDLCYISVVTSIQSRGFLEYLKYKFVRKGRVSLIINLQTVIRIERELVEKIMKEALRYTPTKLGGVVVSATAELLFATPAGRDTYIRNLTKDLRVISDGGIYK